MPSLLNGVNFMHSLRRIRYPPTSEMYRKLRFIFKFRCNLTICPSKSLLYSSLILILSSLAQDSCMHPRGAKENTDFITHPSPSNRRRPHDLDIEMHLGNGRQALSFSFISHLGNSGVEIRLNGR